MNLKCVVLLTYECFIFREKTIITSLAFNASRSQSSSISRQTSNIRQNKCQESTPPKPAEETTPIPVLIDNWDEDELSGEENDDFPLLGLLGDSLTSRETTIVRSPRLPRRRNTLDLHDNYRGNFEADFVSSLPQSPTREVVKNKSKKLQRAVSFYGDITGKYFNLQL